MAGVTAGRPHGGGLARRFGEQFDNPRGIGGRMALSLMARMNGPVNRWAIELLGVGPDHRILDIGCGPGLAVEEAARRAVRGQVVGVDRSELAVRGARTRNRRAIRQGRVEIRVAQGEDLPFPAGGFTRACSINGVGLRNEAAWAEISRVLGPGGKLVAVFRTLRLEGAPKRFDRSRYFGATEAQLEAFASALARHGFAPVQLERAEPGGELMTAAVAVREGRPIRKRRETE
jgi:ubiquinone/menaquinone biosynthesis C-methylase UbiE